MGLLDWFFGKNSTDKPADRAWSRSERGNPTIVIGKHRLTVFDDYRGFKFCIANARRDDRDPYFSDLYESEDQAKNEALAWIGIGPSRYKSDREKRDDLTRATAGERTRNARARISAFPQKLAEIEDIIANAKKLSDLRKAALKVKTLKNATHGEIRNDSDITDDEIDSCVAYFNKAADLGEIIEAKIVQRKASRENKRLKH